MKSFDYSRAVAAALIGMAVFGTAPAALAEVKDYEFQLVDQMIKTAWEKAVTALSPAVPPPAPASAGSNGARSPDGAGAAPTWDI